MGELLALITGAFMVGFLSQTHCVGMCGPVIGILGINNSYKRIPAAIIYNLGRISTYTFLGVIGGLIATTISDISHIQSAIRLIAGAIMIFIGLQLLGLPQFLAFVEKPFQFFWKPLQKFSKRLFPIKTALGTYVVGCVWGFLPCGAVYGPLAVAMGTGSVSSSAIIMFSFGLGTLPMMISLAIFGTFIGRFFAKKSVRIIAGLIILTMAIYYLATIGKPENVKRKAMMEDQRSEQVRLGDKSVLESLKDLGSMGHDHGGDHMQGNMEGHTMSDKGDSIPSENDHISHETHHSNDTQEMPDSHPESPEPHDHSMRH